MNSHSPSCKGSTFSPNIDACYAGLANIDVNADYDDGYEWSSCDCYMVYATNGSGEEPISGQTLKTITTNILQQCGHHKGSFGTGNCNKCHVTVNYRSTL